MDEGEKSLQLFYRFLHAFRTAWPVLLAGVIFCFLIGVFSSTQFRFFNGAVAPRVPIQDAVNIFDKPFAYKEYTVTPLATFSGEFLVLSKMRYFFPGKETEISPIDLAVGWGRMSDGVILNTMRIWQGARCYFWQSRGQELPIPAEEINAHSANMHIIPAAPYILPMLGKMKRGDLVYLRGYLVSVHDTSGWKWTSSLSRQDKGWGSCELLWLEEVQFR